MSFAARIVLSCDASPVIDCYSQAVRAGLSHFYPTGLSAALGHRRNPCQGPNSAGITISMVGRGAWPGNVFVERLWRTIKYEEVCIRAYDSVSEGPRQSDVTSLSIIRHAHIAALGSGHRTRCTSISC